MKLIHLEIVNNKYESMHAFIPASQLSQLLQVLSDNWFSIDITADALMKYMKAGNTHAVDSNPPDCTAYLSIVNQVDLTKQSDEFNAMLKQHCPTIYEEEI